MTKHPAKTATTEHGLNPCSKMPLADFMANRLELKNDTYFEDTLAPDFLKIIVNNPRRVEFVNHTLTALAAFLATISVIATLLPSPTSIQIVALWAITLFLFLYRTIRKHKSLEPSDHNIHSQISSEEGTRQHKVFCETISVLLSGQYSLIMENYLGEDHEIPKKILKRRNRLNLLLPEKGDRSLILGGSKFKYGKWYIQKNNPPLFSHNATGEQVTFPTQKFGQFLTQTKHNDLFERWLEILEEDGDLKTATYCNTLKEIRAVYAEAPQSSQEAVAKSVAASGTETLGEEGTIKLMQGTYSSFEKRVKQALPKIKADPLSLTYLGK